MINNRGFFYIASFFGEKAKGVDCGEEVAAWLSKFLQLEGVRLVQHVPELEFLNSRTKKKRSPAVEGRYKKMYQNKSSVMIANESSLAELNGRLALLSDANQAVKMDRFKPNVVVAGSSPWDEDYWLHVQLGNDALMFQVMPCTRCSQTTYSREDASRGKEPYRTLATFRQTKNPADRKNFSGAPLFGSVFGIDRIGFVKVGDLVTAVKVDLV